LPSELSVSGAGEWEFWIKLKDCPVYFFNAFPKTGTAKQFSHSLGRFLPVDSLKIQPDK
jgi:hypothetical protein